MAWLEQKNTVTISINNIKGLRREISKTLRVNLETSLPLIKHIFKNGL